jgi:hypothetical protein
MFQSTPPARAATAAVPRWSSLRGVSIHAARAGGDNGACRSAVEHLFQSTPPARARPTASGARSAASGFNPRRPRGRRPRNSLKSPRDRAFQSTPPARAATSVGILDVRPKCFNPRRPRGRRPIRIGNPLHLLVSIHAARAGGDIQTTAVQPWRSVSIHAARAGGDDGPFIRASAVFQSTPPARAATPVTRLPES